MKSLKKLIIAGTIAGASLFNPLFSQKVIKTENYYEDGKKVTHSYYSNGVEGFVYDEKVDKYGKEGTYFRDSEGNLYRRTYGYKSPEKKTKTTDYSNVNRDAVNVANVNKGYSNKNNFTLEDGVAVGAAVVGSYLLIKGLVNLFKKPSYTPTYNYDYSSQDEIQEDYSAPIEKPEEKNLIENFDSWLEKNVETKGDFFGSENKTEDKNSFFGKENTTKEELWSSEDVVSEKNKVFWGINNEISTFKKDFQGAMKGDKKVYIKYISPLLNKGAKTIAEKGIPGGSMIYEIVREGPDNFWLKKVEDSEKISGEFETKGDKVAGGIEMIIDDLTGNYRKKVYDITKSSFKFWEEVEGEKIKRKYGENSKEYLNWIVTGSKEDPIAY